MSADYAEPRNFSGSSAMNNGANENGEDGEPLHGLEEKAHDFAQELSDVISGFLGRTLTFKATRLGPKFSIKPDEPITLSVGQRQLLSLDVWYRCIYDHAGAYLVVDESSIKVFGGPSASGDPLFRYEYERGLNAELPASHLHVHAHRDHLVMAMALAGESGAPRRRPTKDIMNGARMATLHFPLGGHRFRPALEDVLQMLRSEFGVDCGETWEEALPRARERYRRGQTGAVVRDCPSEAVRVLEELGYGVTPPKGDAPADKVNRLHAF